MTRKLNPDRDYSNPKVLDSLCQEEARCWLEMSDT